MNEYVVKRAEVLKEIEKEMEKAEEEAKDEKEKEKDLKRKKIGAMAPKGFRINFEEMMEARQKVKTKDGKKSTSVGTRHVNRGDDNKEKSTSFSVERKNAKNTHEQNLYIKLVLARNKFHQKFDNDKNIYQVILMKVNELKEISQLPEFITNEIDDLTQKLKLPENLIVDEDVQRVSTDDDISDPIGVKVTSLDDLIKN